jgi:hypothetical protein
MLAGPGDVLAVSSDRTAFSWLIRLGAILRHQTPTVDHIAIVHHIDAAGTWWGIEGRPGGVGWIDLRVYDNRWLRSNARQPKTPEQRQAICDAAVALLGTPYDWEAIVGDGAVALGLDHLWQEADFTDRAPGHVVCSSLAAWVYRERAHLDEPGVPMLRTTPGDWYAFFLARGW